MRELLLVGAGGLAREVLSMIGESQSWTCVGVLDDDPVRWGSTVGGVRVLGGIEQAADHASARFAICIGSGRVRQAVAERLGRMGVDGARYATIVDPTVHLPSSCTVGAGSILLAQVVLTADVTIGRHVVVMPHVTLTHDDSIEDYVTLAAGVQLGGGVRVRRRAYLGMNASVRERSSVGEDAILGMGATLLGDLPARETWVGTPARRVQHRDQNHVQP